MFNNLNIASMLIGVVIVIGVVGMLFLLFVIFKKFAVNKTLVDNIVKLTPNVATALQKAVIKGAVDTPQEKAVMVFSTLADMSVNYVEVIGNKQDLTSEQKLQMAKDYFKKSCTALGISIDGFEETVVELFLEWAVKAANEKEQKILTKGGYMGQSYPDGAGQLIGTPISPVDTTSYPVTSDVSVDAPVSTVTSDVPTDVTITADAPITAVTGDVSAYTPVSTADISKA